MSPLAEQIIGVFGLCVASGIAFYLWGWIDGARIRKMDQADCKHCGTNGSKTP